MKEEDEKPSVSGDLTSAESLPSRQKPKAKPEVRKASAEQRAVLAGLLIQQTNDLAKEAQERKIRKSLEVIELNSGEKITLAALTAIVTALARPYKALFPNESSFFAGLSRLSPIKFDPLAYIKPKVVGLWICELIYDRFAREVLPALRALNPKYTNGTRAFKHFQFLTSEAEEKLVQFREEAIEEMADSTTMLEFRKRMYRKYGVPYQAEMFA